MKLLSHDFAHNYTSLIQAQLPGDERRRTAGGSEIRVRPIGRIFLLCVAQLSLFVPGMTFAQAHSWPDVSQTLEVSQFSFWRIYTTFLRMYSTIWGKEGNFRVHQQVRWVSKGFLVSLETDQGNIRMRCAYHT